MHVFPPSRGRRGFEIKENGDFVLYDIRPADGPVAVIGRWEYLEKNKIKVQFEDVKRESYVITIVSADDRQLKAVTS